MVTDILENEALILKRLDYLIQLIELNDDLMNLLNQKKSKLTMEVNDDKNYNNKDTKVA